MSSPVASCPQRPFTRLKSLYISIIEDISLLCAISWIRVSRFVSKWYALFSSRCGTLNQNHKSHNSNYGSSPHTALVQESPTGSKLIITSPAHAKSNQGSFPVLPTNSTAPSWGSTGVSSVGSVPPSSRPPMPPRIKQTVSPHVLTNNNLVHRRRHTGASYQQGQIRSVQSTLISPTNTVPPPRSFSLATPTTTSSTDPAGEAIRRAITRCQVAAVAALLNEVEQLCGQDGVENLVTQSLDEDGFTLLHNIANLKHCRKNIPLLLTAHPVTSTSTPRRKLPHDRNDDLIKFSSDENPTTLGTFPSNTLPFNVSQKTSVGSTAEGSCSGSSEGLCGTSVSLSSERVEPPSSVPQSPPSCGEYEEKNYTPHKQTSGMTDDECVEVALLKTLLRRVGRSRWALTCNARGASENRYAALHMAAIRGKTQLAKALIECGATVDVESRFLSTPLMLAANCGHLEMCKLFLMNGADPNKVNQMGVGALGPIIQSGDIQLIGLFLKHGANPSTVSEMLEACRMNDSSQNISIQDIERVIARSPSVKVSSAN